MYMHGSMKGNDRGVYRIFSKVVNYETKLLIAYFS